jgi:hypothetical protein
MDTRGWNDIAYSFLINHEGTIYEGRGAGIAGGHTAGHNTVSHAVCLTGNYDNDQPTVAAMRSIVELARHGYSEGWWREGFTGGHRDASGASTSCPGRNLHSQISTLNQSINLQEENMPLTEQEKQDIAKLTVDELMSRSFNESFTTPGTPISRTVANYLVQTYGLGVRSVRASEKGFTSAQIETIAGAVSSGVAAAVADELAKRLDG